MLFSCALLFTSFVLASEARLELDPAADLAALKTTGHAAVRVEHQGELFRSDASAVISVNPARLYAAAQDYEHYADMGMPNLRESHLVARDGDRLDTWAWMTMAGQESKHYLEVRMLPVVGKGEGMQWELVHRAPGWKYQDSPAFTRLDGSFYIQPLADGTTYCRYFLAATIDTAIPGFLVDLVARRAFRDGVKGVVDALARKAAQ